MKINYQNFAFFGASVTKQKNSYADCLMDLIKKKYKKFGYGSMHLSDAGICFVDDVIQYKPDICFIDWFSTSNTDYEKSILKYLDCIIYKFLKNNIEPILIIFPITSVSESRLNMYKNIKKYCETHNIKIIDIYSKSLEEKIDIRKLIRDYIHTTKYGSKYYASNIFNFLNSNLHSNFNIVCPIKNKYCEIKKTNFNFTIKKYLELNVEDEIIGIYQTIGPYSGEVDIYKNDAFIEKQNMWDRWSFYERETFKISIKEPGHYIIKLSEEFKMCNYKSQAEIDWKSYKNLIKIKEIYHIGNINILSYE